MKRLLGLLCLLAILLLAGCGPPDDGPTDPGYVSGALEGGSPLRL